MEHPLINDLSGLTIEELQSKISDLNKKLAFAMQTQNQALACLLYTSPSPRD